MIPEEPTMESIQPVLNLLMLYEVWNPEALGYANDVKSAEWVATRLGWNDRLDVISDQCRKTGTCAVFPDLA